MKDWPWRHIGTVVLAFLIGYGLSEKASGFNYVMLHWSWESFIAGAFASGLYTGGLVQSPPGGKV